MIRGIARTLRRDWDDLMFEAIAFDSHRLVKNLTAAGLTKRQAEALAAALGEELTEHWATNADLSLLKWVVGFNLAFSTAILWTVIGVI